MTGSVVEVDFETADNSLFLERFYNSISYGNAGNNIMQRSWVSAKAGVLRFNMNCISTSLAQLWSWKPHRKRPSLSGSPVCFPHRKPDTAPADKPTTRCSLSGPTLRPGRPSWAGSTQWQVTDQDDNVWLMQTYLSAATEKYTTALPVSVTFRGGLVWTFTYGTYNEPDIDYRQAMASRSRSHGT